MKQLVNYLSALFLLLISCTTSLSQAIDINLIIGKWKFVKATKGGYDHDYQYNGNPRLTFVRNGNWITEDINPVYRQSGSCKIENNILVRDPEKSGMKNKEPYKRKIEKLSNTELVLSDANYNGFRHYTFYFTRLE